MERGKPDIMQLTCNLIFLITDHESLKEDLLDVRYIELSLVIQEIGRIFINEDNKEAEEILRILLDSTDPRIIFLALYIFQKAEDLGKVLEEETVKKLKELESNPSNQAICIQIGLQLKLEKVCFN